MTHSNRRETFQTTTAAVNELPSSEAEAAQANSSALENNGCVHDTYIRRTFLMSVDGEVGDR